jgi:hypothetical protein
VLKLSALPWNAPLETQVPIRSAPSTYPSGRLDGREDDFVLIVPVPQSWSCHRKQGSKVGAIGLWELKPHRLLDVFDIQAIGTKDCVATA